MEEEDPELSQEHPLLEGGAGEDYGYTTTSYHQSSGFLSDACNVI